jgi:hypothetical protein
VTPVGRTQRRHSVWKLDTPLKGSGKPRSASSAMITRSHCPKRSAKASRRREPYVQDHFCAAPKSAASHGRNDWLLRAPHRQATKAGGRLGQQQLFDQGAGFSARLLLTFVPRWNQSELLDRPGSHLHLRSAPAQKIGPAWVTTAAHRDGSVSNQSKMRLRSSWSWKPSCGQFEKCGETTCLRRHCIALRRPIERDQKGVVLREIHQDV